jgi:hypothetical protein
VLQISTSNHKTRYSVPTNCENCPIYTPRWFSGWFSPMWRHVMVVFAYVAPHQPNSGSKGKDRGDQRKIAIFSRGNRGVDGDGPAVDGGAPGTTTARQRRKEGGRWRSQLAHGFRPMRSTTAANTHPHVSPLIAPLCPPTRSSRIRVEIWRIHLEFHLSGASFLPRPRSSGRWSQSRPSSTRRAMMAGGTRQNEHRGVGVRWEEAGVRRIDGDQPSAAARR